MTTPTSTTEQTDTESVNHNHSDQLSVLRGILESIKSPVFSVDKNHNYTHYNSAHAEVMKLLYNAKIELNTNMPAHMTVKEDREKARKNLTRTLSGEYLIEEAFSGEEERTRLYYELIHNPIYDEMNNIMGVAVLARDITVNKSDENKLRTSEKSYRRLFESAKDGILILDAHSGQIADVNPYLIKMLGYTHQELLGKELWEIGVFKNIVASKEGFLQLQTNEYIRFDDMPLETRDGQQINVEFISNVYLVDKIRVIQCNIRDITERKIIHEQLLFAKAKAEESDRLKTAFLHNISHEIRTPMNAIVGFSKLLNAPDLIPEKRNRFTEIITQSSNQLLAIINDIISIAAIEAGQEKIHEHETNLNSICTLLQEQFTQKAIDKNVLINLTTIASEENTIIFSDATKLTQILTNLLSNALKFTDKGHINFGYIIKNDQIEFFVEDTGMGIAQNMQDVIFNRFRQIETSETRNFGGSGLGLSISKAYIEMLGGKIWLTSELLKGSVFYFSIPFKNANPPGLKTMTSKIDTGFNAKTILITEDEDSNYLLLEEMLANLNPNLIRATTGLEAINLCKSNRNIDLILMDIKMPGMDGYEATKQIKKWRPEIPIIAQTAYSTSTDKQKALACGCSDFICKPIDRELLLSKILKQFKK